MWQSRRKMTSPIHPFYREKERPPRRVDDGYGWKRPCLPRLERRPGKGEKFPRHSLKGERVFMDVSRRGFLKISGAALAASGIGISLSPAKANAQPLKMHYTKESLTVCPYCSVGCGIIVSVRDGKVINTEGDPDHPINQGTLCPKGGSIYQMAVNKNRLDKPLYRAPLRDGVEGSRAGNGPWTRSPTTSRRAGTRASRSATTRASSSTARKASPPSARPPWTTKSASFIRNS